MEAGGIALIAMAVLAYALVSQKLERIWITMPMVFAAFGWLIGRAGFGLVPLQVDHGVIHAIAELTLILVLFSDAARIDTSRLYAEHTLPQRMLMIGMPLTILVGALAALMIIPGASLAAAFLVAAILAPTDAALGQAVVSNPSVPVRIRQALNVESGLNDGIALPLVLVFAIWAGAPAGGASSASGLALFAILQVTLGPLVGIIIGYVGARLIDVAAERNWISEPFQGLAILSTAILAFAAAEAIGGNGFISAFAAGLVFGATVRHRCTFLFEFMESEGHLLTLLTFLVFGAIMIPDALHHITWQTIALSLLFLTVVRMLPVALSLIGTGLSMRSVLFLGWFGPRGLASILFALLIVEKYPVKGGDEILACVVVTVLLSIFLHGITAVPFSKFYGKFVRTRGKSPEMLQVSEMPVRHGS